MKKKLYCLIILIILILGNNFVFSQSNKDIIVYEYGDSINHYIKNYLMDKKIENYYCYYRNINMITKRIYISEFHKVDMYKDFVKSNSRYIVIGSEKIPIIFDSDDNFAISLNRNEKTNYGPEIINKQTKTGGGFFIEFKLNNNSEIVILETGFEQ